MEVGSWGGGGLVGAGEGRQRPFNDPLFVFRPPDRRAEDNMRWRCAVYKKSGGTGDGWVGVRGGRGEAMVCRCVAAHLCGRDGGVAGGRGRHLITRCGATMAPPPSDKQRCWRVQMKGGGGAAVGRETGEHVYLFLGGGSFSLGNFSSTHRASPPTGGRIDRGER